MTRTIRHGVRLTAPDIRCADDRPPASGELRCIAPADAPACQPAPDRLCSEKQGRRAGAGFMSFTDIATRTYNHSFRLDPVVRTLLDTDFYKLLMLQLIWKKHRDTPVTFGIVNRSANVRIADEIPKRNCAPSSTTLARCAFTSRERIWLAGNTFYGVKQIFEPDFIEWLANFKLPEYELAKRDGQYELNFHGPGPTRPCGKSRRWPSSTNCGRARSHGMGRFELDVLYARAKAKLWTKIERCGS